MQLKVLRNSSGRYNILSLLDETFEFSMGIVDEKGKIIEIDGVKAIISYSGDPIEQDNFKSPIENLQYVFTKCFQYANKVWSTRDYKKECLLFAKIYKENFIGMDEAMTIKHIEATKKKIKELEKELEIETILPDLTETVNSVIDSEIQTIKKFIALKENELSQLKEDSKMYKEVKKYIEHYNDEIKKYSLYTTAILNN